MAPTFNKYQLIRRRTKMVGCHENPAHRADTTVHISQFSLCFQVFFFPFVSSCQYMGEMFRLNCTIMMNSSVCQYDDKQWTTSISISMNLGGGRRKNVYLLIWLLIPRASFRHSKNSNLLQFTVNRASKKSHTPNLPLPLPSPLEQCQKL